MTIQRMTYSEFIKASISDLQDFGGDELLARLMGMSKVGDARYKCASGKVIDRRNWSPIHRPEQLWRCWERADYFAFAGKTDCSVELETMCLEKGYKANIRELSVSFFLSKREHALYKALVLWCLANSDLLSGGGGGE